MATSSKTGAAATCIKILLTIFNFVFWLSGVAVLILGVWMKFELYIYMELTTVYYDAAPYILMGVGAGIVLVGSLGCMCTIKGHSALLYVFSIILMLVFVVELATAVTVFIYEKKLSDGFKTGLKTAMDTYATESRKKEAVDGIQNTLKCCGSANYTDWFSIEWGAKSPREVPKSCCIEKECTTTNVNEIHTEGCFLKLSSFMQSNYLMIGGIAIGFAFLQLFGALLACCLAKNINRAKYEQMA